jgi:hypothetical protein
MRPLSLDAARLMLNMTQFDLWVAYFALGGYRDAQALGAYVRGRTTTSDSAHNVIVHALNEVFAERGQDSPLTYR